LADGVSRLFPRAADSAARRPLFEARDASGPPVVIISQATADRAFAGESALGHFVDMGDQKAEIVGVVGSIRRTSLVDEPWADLCYPFERSASRR
jgi:hypothetical protein